MLFSSIFCCFFLCVQDAAACPAQNQLMCWEQPRLHSGLSVLQPPVGALLTSRHQEHGVRSCPSNHGVTTKSCNILASGQAAFVARLAHIPWREAGRLLSLLCLSAAASSPPLSKHERNSSAGPRSVLDRIIHPLTAAVSSRVH